jgi:hypothetical protein
MRLFCWLIDIFLDVVKDWEAKDPHLFELNKSNLRVFSVTETIFSLGGMLGPLLTGSLFETVGFFYMTMVLGKSHHDPAKYNIPPLTKSLMLSSCHFSHPSGSLVALAVRSGKLTFSLNA